MSESPTWKSASLSDLLPGFVEDSVEAVNGVVQPLSDILGALADILDAAATFLIAFEDPLTAITQRVIDEINNQIEALFNTGVFFTYLVPKNLLDRKGVDEILRRIVQSFDDEADPNRPQFAGGAEVGAIILLAGGPAIPSLISADFTAEQYQLLLDGKFSEFADETGVTNITDFVSFMAFVDGLRLFRQLLDIREFESFADATNPVFAPDRKSFKNGGGFVTSIPDGGDDFPTDANPKTHFEDLSRLEITNQLTGLRLKFLSGKNKGTETIIKSYDPSEKQLIVNELPFNMEVGDVYDIFAARQSRPPDWYSKTVAGLFPDLGVIFTALQASTRFITAAVSIVDAADEFVAALRDKATQLQQIVDQLNAAIEQLIVLLGGTGIFALALPPESGGLDGLADRMLSAQDAPPFDDGTHYTAVAVALAGGPGFEVLNSILGPVIDNGLSVNEGLAEQAQAQLDKAVEELQEVVS